MSHPKVTEGFFLPSEAHPPPLDRFGYGVDPAFIFSSQAYPSSIGGLHKPTTLSDLDLGFDDPYAASRNPLLAGFNPASLSNNPNAQHHNFGGGAGSNGYLGSSGAFDAFGFRPEHSQQALFESLSQRAGNGGGPATSLPHYLSSARASPSLPAFAPPAAPSPRDSRSPSAGTDLFGHDSPENQFGSYSSIGESVAPSSATAPSSSAAAALAAAAPKRRQSSTDRSRSTGVGKAPNSGTRSRSARRVSTSGSYQSLGGAGGATGTGGTGAIVMPSAAPAASGASHPIAMSMPAYPGGAGSPWFASAGPLASFSQASAQTAASPREEPMDPSGWRPSTVQKGPAAVPASAPVTGSKSKKVVQLDNVPEDPGQKQAALLTEKRRKRRESHNAVERRRRDNINDRITELASLLPECLLDQVNAPDDGDSPNPLSPGLPPPSLLATSPATPGTSSSQQAAAATAAGKPNKGIILAKSVEYIRYLQQLVDLHSHRNAELERMVSDLNLSPNAASTASSSSSDHRHLQQPQLSSPEHQFPPPQQISSTLEEYDDRSPYGMFSPGSGLDDPNGWAIKSEEGEDEAMRDV